MPGCIASSTRRTFSAVDQRRRRCTEVITSTREIGPSDAFDIVILIGECLCLIGYAACPVKTGCAPPDLNSVKRIWLYLRERFLSHRLLADLDAVMDACCQAWNVLTNEPKRVQSLTAYPYLKQVNA